METKLNYKTLRLILGDQLNSQHSWFTQKSPDVLYVMMELRSETDYAKHHIQKIVGFFAAMREFAKHIQNQGHDLIYYQLDDPCNRHTFADNLQDLVDKYSITCIEIQEPDEYRLDIYLKEFLESQACEYQIVSAEHFMAKRDELEIMFGKKDNYLMENFYRNMRKKHKILMEGSKPYAGKWNLDAANREAWRKSEQVPKAKIFANNLSDIYSMILKTDIECLGQIETEHFVYPINREQALEMLEFFCKNLLVKFGTYQDAMIEENDFLFHSRLSFALNTKMLSPKEVIDAATEEYSSRQDQIAYSQLEGFVRQILGWREFMRSYYWVTMPEFAHLNFFGHTRALPKFYWDADTKMNCLHHAIKTSLNNAYAHHIQRLMVTGNFALLTGIDPNEVDKWYLGIYIDAIEWVEITNTRGMSQWADGGGLATKPYISSANYINKMSNYCKNCHYDYKSKLGENSCPFNSLYWNFLDEHRSKLANNQRMSMVYKIMEKFSRSELDAIKQRAALCLANLDNL